LLLLFFGLPPLFLFLFLATQQSNGLAAAATATTTAGSSDRFFGNSDGVTAMAEMWMEETAITTA